jgi:CBS domain containing-hemolysin-like protein
MSKLTQKALTEAERMNATYILLNLDTYGGAVDDADKIRTLLLKSKIPTLVFIKNNAASAGALISIACDSIYMASGSTIDAAIDEAFEHGVSRMPVMSEDEDGNQDVVGIAYTKDLMKRIRAGEGSQSVDSLIRPAVVIPENKPVAKLMREMQRDHFHMAIVADEYGSITGLVTLEDCLEELVGEIVDEHDDEDPMVRSLPNGESLVDAGMAISEFNDHFQTKLDEDEFDTVGGFLFGILEHVPVTGESLEIDGWRFVVDELEGRRITRVRVLPVVDVE